MNKDELKAKAETLKGRAKDAFGSLTKDGGGLFDRVRGAVRDKLGKGKGKSKGEASAPSHTSTPPTHSYSASGNSGG